MQEQFRALFVIVVLLLIIAFLLLDKNQLPHHQVQLQQPPNFHHASHLFDTNIREANFLGANDDDSYQQTIRLLKSAGDNCSNILTKEILELQKTVRLAENVDNLEQHFKTVFGSPPDGHAGLFPGQKALYVFLSHQPWVRQVCEIGFNAGHSALFWLIGSEKTKLVSFDIASWGYTKPMGEYLQSVFPGRLETVWGDSRTTVPSFWQQKAGQIFACDIVVIDGSHNHDYVLADLRNMRVGANTRRHLIIMDDYPCRVCTDVGSAFVDARSELLVEKYSDCIAYPDSSRGMAFAYYR